MAKTDRIPARTLKGFRDYPPELMLPRERIIETARRVYRSFGYAPIDTPALEYVEVLTGKGSEETDKQLYQFEDQGGRRVGMRFDLTVPLARFAAQNAQGLGLPFKRYHIGSVWRGEKPQVGRYREFVQADFDTVGATGVASDIETVAVLHELLQATGFQRFAIRVNHRGVLDGVLELAGLADRSTEVLRALDKLAKVGPGNVAKELAATADASDQQVANVLALTETAGDGAPTTNDTVLSRLEKLVSGSDAGAAGVARLQETLAGLEATGVMTGGLLTGGDAAVVLDPAIARGLDYYTGIVMETFLTDRPSIGSVASGGRYDSLANLYTAQAMPGIGASLGVDRLLAAMEELGMIGGEHTPAAVMVAFFAADRLPDYLALAAAVRAAGVAVELYPEPKKLGKQLQHASKRGFRIALIAGEDELAEGVCQIKTLADGQTITTPMAETPARVVGLLNGGGPPDNDGRS
ncbi:MAG: histidine--tRNA ligase [Planctomycetota bacterium]